MALPMDQAVSEPRLIAMPPRAPLAMPVQDLQQAPTPTTAGPKRSPLGRIAVFLPALAATGLMIWGLWSLFHSDGVTPLEYVLLALIGITFVWVTLAVSTVGAGLLGRAPKPAQGGAPLDVALLIPIYNENPSVVFGNARAMLDALARHHSTHRFSLFFLSDTQDTEIAGQEESAFAALHETAQIPMHYRRRARNTDRKVGNIVDWITGWGGAFEAMIVLDADSLMSGRSIDRLASEMSADPQAGLIQTYPQLIAAETVFARLQQFSNRAYGWLLAEGLAHWAQTEGNYWGHNAIIRTRAFAAAAGLPRISGLFGDKLILSHDFVEAGLLRRAGWRVRFLPRMSGSFEETPSNLIDYALRDQRWCRGNLQHLRLLGARGLHPVSRFHLFQGAMAYLMSPAWFVLLVFWTLLGRDAETNVIRYFNEANPMFPNWPPEMTHLDSATFLLIMYAMLLAPKLTAAAMIATRRRAVRSFGGYPAFVVAVLVEIVLSVAYAPILMIQQTRAVLRGLLGLSQGWSPQRRGVVHHGLGTLIRFHWVETVIGALLLWGFFAGLVSWWLVPIMGSLLLAVPLSALSGLRFSDHVPRWLRLENPLTLREPAIVQSARAASRELGETLQAR